MELVANTFNLDDHSVGAVIATALCGFLIIVALIKRPVPMIATGVPLGLAGGLAYLGLAPLGGGRTDLHLIVLVIAGSMAGLDLVLTAVVNRWGATTETEGGGDVARKLAALAPLALTALLIINVALIDRPEPRPYPDNDARTLVAYIDDRRTPSETVVLHRSGYAYGLYSERASRPVSDGYLFEPRFTDDGRVARLRWSTEATVHANRLAELVASTDGIWLLSSPIGGPEQLAGITDILDTALGFELAERKVGRNAVLDHWVRPAP